MPRAATTKPGVLKVTTPTRLPLVTPASRSAAADFFVASSSSAYVAAVSANTNASLWGNLCAVLSNIAVRSIVPALSCGNSHRAGRPAAYRHRPSTNNCTMIHLFREEFPGLTAPKRRHDGVPADEGDRGRAA